MWVFKVKVKVFSTVFWDISVGVLILFLWDLQMAPWPLGTCGDLWWSCFYSKYFQIFYNINDSSFNENKNKQRKITSCSPILKWFTQTLLKRELISIRHVCSAAQRESVSVSLHYCWNIFPLFYAAETIPYSAKRLLWQCHVMPQGSRYTAVAQQAASFL